MHNLKQMLLDEAAFLEEILSAAKSRLSHVPEGSLRTSTSHGKRQYYKYLPGNPPKLSYIPVGQADQVRALAQKDYDHKVETLALKRLREIRMILKDYNDFEIEKLYASLPEYRQQWTAPAVKPWETFLEDWLSIPYQGKNFPENNSASVILASNGVRVRSKSEKILADYFLQQNIPFKYECPLSLPPYGVIYPDFTFLSKYTRQEIYWEHEGMMDSPDYANKAISKITLYERNQIYPGERLILSFESSRQVINMQVVEKMVQKYLL